MLNRFYSETQQAPWLQNEYYKNPLLLAFLNLVSSVTNFSLIAFSLPVLLFCLYQAGHVGLSFLSSAFPHFISLIGPAIVLALARAVTAS